MRRLYLPLGIVAALVLLRLATCADITHCLTQPRMDFHAYYCGGARALAGDPVYGPTCDGSLRYLYPPPSLLLFVPLALLPFTVAQFAYYALIGLSVAVWLAFVRAMAGTRAMALALVAYLPMLHQALTLGQITPLVVTLSCVAWWLMVRGRPHAGGAVLAVSLLIKPTEAWWFAWALLARPSRDGLKLACMALFVVGTACVLSLCLAPGMALAWPHIAASRVWLGGFPHHYLLGSSLWWAAMARRDER